MPYRRKLNTFTGEIEVEIPGILKSFSRNVLLTKNNLKRPYRHARVEITYSDSSNAIVGSLLFESLRKKYPNNFETDSIVTLRVFTEGKRKGNSIILAPEVGLIPFNELPNNIRENLFWVGDEYRTNELSLLPGGFCVIIEYNHESVFGYDKIKYERKYVRKIISNYLSKKNIDILELPRNEARNIIGIHVSRIYFREFSSLEEYESSEYQLLWANDDNEFLPWE